MPHAGGTVELKFLLPPEGQDPDTLVREQGAESFRALVATAKPLSVFLLEELQSKVDLASADGRSRLTALVRPLLTRLPVGVYRELLLERLAELVGLAPERLDTLLATPSEGANLTRRPDSTEKRSALVRKAITLILHHPAAALELGDVADLDYLDLPGVELLRRLLEVVREQPQINAAGLEERFRHDPEGRFLERLVGQPLLDDDDAAPQVLKDNVARLVERGLKDRLHTLTRRGDALSDTQRAEMAEIGARLTAAQTTPRAG